MMRSESIYHRVGVRVFTGSSMNLVFFTSGKLFVSCVLIYCFNFVMGQVGYRDQGFHEKVLCSGYENFLI